MFVYILKRIMEKSLLSRLLYSLEPVQKKYRSPLPDEVLGFYLRNQEGVQVVTIYMNFCLFVTHYSLWVI